MKRFISFLVLLIAGLTVYAQGPRSAIFGATAASTMNGAVAVNIDLPQFLTQVYDYSYQVIPALSGAGDSLHCIIELKQANDMAGTAWTEITSAQDTATAATGVLIEGTDAKGMLHRLTVTGISSDTATVTVYYIYKLDKKFQ